MVTEKRSLILGCLSMSCPSLCRKVWNERFGEEGSDATFLLYPTEPCHGEPCTAKKCLHVRLSEMYLHHRFAYIIHEPFQQIILPLLDELDSSGMEQGSVNAVINNGGVLKGYWCHNDDTQMKLFRGSISP